MGKSSSPEGLRREKGLQRKGTNVQPLGDERLSDSLRLFKASVICVFRLKSDSSRCAAGHFNRSASRPELPDEQRCGMSFESTVKRRIHFPRFVPALCARKSSSNATFSFRLSQPSHKSFNLFEK
jgi:hypothetical protein